MTSVYVGNLDSKTSTRLVESELEAYGEILSVKIPRATTSLRRRYAFVEFKHRLDAQFAIHSWNSKFNWIIELSRNSIANWNTSNASSCYGCGGSGHFARHCPSHYSKDVKNKGDKQSQRGTTEKNQVASTSIWKPVPPPPPPWVELPEDITAKILHKLGPADLLMSAQKVCTSWRKICRDPCMWRVIDMYKLGDVGHKLPYDRRVTLFRTAVDLSQGQVTEINIRDFAEDYLLEYILERCGHLRCLRFAFCDNLSFEALRKSKGFPLLEELHSHHNPIEKEEIEAIGRSCPMLNTFSLNFPVSGLDLMEALPIAEFMPKLRHLQLLGNQMPNDVLEAILNGCPKLESLDLRHCFTLNLEGELGERCAQQIKTLRGPHDPLEDYECYDYWAQENISDQDSDSYLGCDYFSSDLDYEDIPDPFQFGGGLLYDDFRAPFQFEGGFDYDDYCDPYQFDREWH